MSIFLIALSVAQLSAAPNSSGDCGWLIVSGDVLVSQPDHNLQPLGPKPLPAAPQGAKAAYCNRATLITNVGDERLLKLGLPLVIRSGGKEGVLESNPDVLFNYHPIGDHYVAGAKPVQP